MKRISEERLEKNYEFVKQYKTGLQLYKKKFGKNYLLLHPENNFFEEFDYKKDAELVGKTSTGEETFYCYIDEDFYDEEEKIEAKYYSKFLRKEQELITKKDSFDAEKLLEMNRAKRKIKELEAELKALEELTYKE